MTNEQIQAKLDALKNNTNKSSNGNETQKHRFKPQAGKQVVRLLPNFAFGKDVTFLPLSFYYNFRSEGKYNQTWLSPSQFDEPDAIFEFNQVCLKKAYDENDAGRKKELFTWANKFQPKQSIIVALIVRDHEDEGIKFWNITLPVMKQIDAISDDPDYGNVFDLKSGRDITIEYTPKDPNDSNSYPKINILPKPKETAASTDKELLETIVKKMPNVIELYTKPTYKQTETALELFLSVEDKDDVPVTKQGRNDDFLKEINEPVEQPKSKVAADLDIDFDNLFNED